MHKVCTYGKDVIYGRHGNSQSHQQAIMQSRAKLDDSKLAHKRLNVIINFGSFS